jgi:site-specific recombinase XerD
MDPTPESPGEPWGRLSFQEPHGPGLSPYRLLDAGGEEIAEANDFLDAQALRGLSKRSLRSYGYSLLNFWRWLSEEPADPSKLSEADLLGYIGFQHRCRSPGAQLDPKTINHRLTVVRSWYRYRTGREMPLGPRIIQNRSCWSEKGSRGDFPSLRPRRRRARPVRVKESRRVVVPLTPQEVRVFLESLRSWRDLAIVGLMLFCGLRSEEVISVTLEDLDFTEGQIRVRGKGNKERVLPLPPQASSCLRAYLSMERPRTRAPELFVCLKGPRRGHSMTLAGLRSLFRYHRKRSRVTKANPHRFRHTFGTDMARAGISVPALMHLMGHTTVRSTLVYVELAPGEVWEEFRRVVAQLDRPKLKLSPEEST